MHNGKAEQSKADLGHSLSAIDKSISVCHSIVKACRGSTELCNTFNSIHIEFSLHHHHHCACFSEVKLAGRGGVRMRRWSKRNIDDTVRSNEDNESNSCDDIQTECYIDEEKSICGLI